MLSFVRKIKKKTQEELKKLKSLVITKIPDKEKK